MTERAFSFLQTNARGAKQIVQLEALRSGIRGTQGLWGRRVTYPGTEDHSPANPEEKK